MRHLAAFAVVILLWSCTDEAAPDDPTRPAATPTERTPPPSPPPAVTIAFVRSEDPAHASYLDGMRLAEERIAEGAALDLRLVEAPTIRAAVSLSPEAIVSIGDPRSIVDARTDLELAEIPVVLAGGDLYTSRSMFRWVFQTAVPWRWQARVIARYLVVDRGHDAVALVTRPGTDEEAIRGTFAAAMAEEGGSVAQMISAPYEGTFEGDLTGFDAAVVAGDTALVEDIADRLPPRGGGPPQLALSAESAVWPALAGTNIPWGTVTPYAYTWSTWAKPIPRVHTFIQRFRGMWGVRPEARQQEGYDAVMALAEALRRTGGEGSGTLLTVLESFRRETYSSTPIRLGPDDHVLAEESHLGLFAFEGAGGVYPSGFRAEALGPTPWRPIMRTFTTDGEKVNLLDRDKRIFFPFWRPKRPTPKYWRSEYGIVSRPSDPLH